MVHGKETWINSGCLGLCAPLPLPKRAVIEKMTNYQYFASNTKLNKINKFLCLAVELNNNLVGLHNKLPPL